MRQEKCIDYTYTYCHGAGGAVRTQVSKGSGRAGGRASGRSVGRSVGQVRRRGGTGRAAERERERDLFLREDRQEVAWRGKGSLHASALLWDTYTSCAKPCPG